MTLVVSLKANAVVVVIVSKITIVDRHCNEKKEKDVCLVAIAIISVSVGGWKVKID